MRRRVRFESGRSRWRESAGSALGTHHLGAAELLALAKELYAAMPRSSLLLTVGAGSLELREGFSEAVQAALPEACAQLEKAVAEILANPTSQRA